MRTLCFHPADANDPHDTIAALRNFHVTRLEWSYIHDKILIDKIKNFDVLFGGACSATSFIAYDRGSQPFKNLGTLDQKGELIIAPWKRTWKKTLWGCVNNPEYERGYLKYLEKYVDAGVQVMQRDEPGANYLVTNFNGCFCRYCMKGFREYLQKRLTKSELEALGIKNVNTFDYSRHLANIKAHLGDAAGDQERAGSLKSLFINFQKESTIKFHERTRQAMEAYAGRPIPFSCNNGAKRWTDIELQFDWFLGELSYDHATSGYLYNAIQKSMAHGCIQVFTMPKKGGPFNYDELESLTRKIIASAYALGNLCMVPWDIYMPKNSPRYFGKPEQYADLYGFIRGISQYLDGYKEEFVWGKSINKYSGKDSTIASIEDVGHDVLISVRKLPGNDKLNPIVIHLVEWSNKSKSFKIKLKREKLFQKKSFICDFMCPAPYNKELHEQIVESENYSHLIKHIRLNTVLKDEFVIAEMPPLNPWGILVLSPCMKE